MADALLAGLEAALRGIARIPFYTIAESLIGLAERVRSYRLWRHWA